MRIIENSMEAYILYHHRSIFQKTLSTGENPQCIFHITALFDDEDVTIQSTFESIVTEDYIFDFEFKNGFFWITKLHDVIVYFLNGNQVIKYGQYSFGNEIHMRSTHSNGDIVIII